MKKKILIIFLSIILLIFAYFSFVFVEYIQRQKENLSMIEYCSQNDTDDCYARMFELLLPKLLLYNAKVDNKKLEFINLDYTSRVDSIEIMKKSDLLIGYGVFSDMDYEEAYSSFFKKRSYAYDCGTNFYNPKEPLSYFSSECLVTDNFLLNGQITSNNIHTLKQKIKELSLENKLIYIKMDIAEADAIGISEILKNKKNIVGFNIALHIRDQKDIIERIQLLEQINRKYLLVARNSPFFDLNTRNYKVKTKYYNGWIHDKIIYLSYINKDFIDEYSLSFIQNTNLYYKRNGIYKYDEILYVPYGNIKWVVYFFENIKNNKGSI